MSSMFSTQRRLAWVLGNAIAHKRIEALPLQLKTFATLEAQGGGSVGAAQSGKQ